MVLTILPYGQKACCPRDAHARETGAHLLLICLPSIPDFWELPHPST